MPIIQQLVDFHELFTQLSEHPIIINDLNNTSEEEKEAIENLIRSKFSSDLISLLPTCQCGETKGEFALGVECPVCRTIVKPVMSGDVTSLLWFRRPEGVAPLINPVVWKMLSDRFTRSSYSILQYIANTDYVPNVKRPPIFDKIFELDIPRGYNSFYDNFDRIMEILFNDKKLQYKNKKGQEDYLLRLIHDHRHMLFSDYLPLPNKSMIIIQSTNFGRYIDNSIIKIIDAIKTIASIDSDSMKSLSVRVKENRTIKTIVKLSNFYYEYFKEDVSKKPGQFRKHIFGSRSNYNFRAVVTSLTDAHAYDEILVPWGVGVTAFRPHLLNKLLRIGYSLNHSIGLLLGHVDKYHETLDRLLQEIINESPYNGIICLENRNPTLLSGSIQVKRITKFKTDVYDHTVSTSALTLKAPNTDNLLNPYVFY